MSFILCWLAFKLCVNIYLCGDNFSNPLLKDRKLTGEELIQHQYVFPLVHVMDVSRMATLQHSPLAASFGTCWVTVLPLGRRIPNQTINTLYRQAFQLVYPTALTSGGGFLDDFCFKTKQLVYISKH